MINIHEIKRQKTLFDDEFSDNRYIKEELKRLRKIELEEKEKQIHKKMNEDAIAITRAMSEKYSKLLEERYERAEKQR